MTEGYLRRLKSLILPAPNHKHYHILMNELFEREFVPMLGRDDNRAADGLYLREEFGASTDSKPCSILEMLIALAGRFDGNSGFDPEEVWENFWNMMRNV